MEGRPMSPEEPLAPKRPRMNLLVVGVGVALLLGAGFWVLESGTQPVDQGASPSAAKTLGAGKESGNVPEVQVVKPARRDVAATLRLPATVSPLQQTTIYAKVSGYLKSIHFDKGDRVKQGQILAVIDAPEIEQQYEQALADYTKVRAPYDGVVTARFADPGALIQGATSSATQAVPLFTIMDVSTLRFYVNVPQEDAPFVKKGTPATIVLKEPAQKTIETTVTRSTMSLDPSTRTMLVEIDILNPGEALVSGMFVEVVLSLRQHRDALVIPPAALVADNSSKAVFVVDQGVAHKVSVTTDIDDGVWVEVTSGLTGAEDVVVVGKSQLVDGKPVKASPYNLPAGKPGSQKY